MQATRRLLAASTNNLLQSYLYLFIVIRGKIACAYQLRIVACCVKRKKELLSAFVVLDSGI